MLGFQRDDGKRGLPSAGVSMSSAFALRTATSWPQNRSTGLLSWSFWAMNVGLMGQILLGVLLKWNAHIHAIVTVVDGAGNRLSPLRGAGRIALKPQDAGSTNVSLLDG
jgi:hypothetical protein